MLALTIKNSHNLSTYEIIKKASVVYNIYVVSKDQNKFIFYVNNYIY